MTLEAACIQNSLRRVAVSLGCAPLGLLGARTFLRLQLLLLRPTSLLAWLPSRLSFPLLGGFSRRFFCAVAFQEVVNHAGAEVVASGVRCICFCQCGGWVLRMFLLLRVECLLCCKNARSCLSAVLRHGAQYGTGVEEVVLQALTFFVIWFCLPFASEGCVHEYQLRVCLVDMGALL